MQEKAIAQRLVRARQLLAEIHHVAIATVNEDGSPHNSPVFMAFDNQLRGFWASNQDSQHSRNIVRDGQVFLVIFDGRQGHGGLYIAARARPLEGNDIQHGYDCLKQLKGKSYGDIGDANLFAGANPQRIYQAEPLHFWINASERNEQGMIIRDKRIEISLEQLQS